MDQCECGEYDNTYRLTVTKVDGTPVMQVIACGLCILEHLSEKHMEDHVERALKSSP